jgi:hypothetical protein
MATCSLKLVTIVAEAVLEPRLIEQIKQFGAKGYSISEVRGEGSRGVRASDWEGRNIRIETLVGPPVAERILDHLVAHYFEHYAVIAWVSDVAVVRGEKYI